MTKKKKYFDHNAVLVRERFITALGQLSPYTSLCNFFRVRLAVAVSTNDAALEKLEHTTLILSQTSQNKSPHMLDSGVRAVFLRKILVLNQLTAIEKIEEISNVLPKTTKTA